VDVRTSAVVTRPIYAESACELSSALARRQYSSAQVVDALLARIALLEPKLFAFATLDSGRVRDEADQADRARARGEVRSPLHGLPITIKECFDVAGEPTTLGLGSRRNHRAPRDAAMVTALKDAGAIVLGRTNLSQTMLFTESRNPLFGETKNPHRLDRSPGGSSGGEAAAIASGMSPLGVGTDIGGSIRVPAHFCGITGLKPTLDRLPSWGSATGIAGQEAVRGTCGPMARSVADLQLFFSALDPTRLAALDPRVPPLPFIPLAESALRGTRVGYYDDDGVLSASAALRRGITQAKDALEDAGLELVKFSPPRALDATFLQIEAMSADGGEILREALLGTTVDPSLKPLLLVASLPESVRLAMAGFFELTRDDLTARLLRALGKKGVATFFGLTAQLRAYRQELIDAMEAAGVSLLLCPPFATPAFAHGGSTGFALAGSYAMLFNATQLPAGVVPVTRVRKGEVTRDAASGRSEKLAVAADLGSDGMPVGVQLVGRAWQEPQVLAAMAAIEARVCSGDEFPKTPVEPGSA
jgi:fatty acid amide hydrolase